jgi:hypothetical protein
VTNTPPEGAWIVATTDEKILNLQHDLERLRVDMQVHKYQLGRIQCAATRLAKGIQYLAKPSQQPKVRQQT